MNDGMIKLDQKLVDNLVKEHLSAAVLSVLADKKEHLLRQMSDQILNLKVDEDGNINSYSSYNKYSWIEQAMNKELRSTIIQTIQENLSSIKPDIEKAVKAELRKSGNKIASSMMEGLFEAIKYDFSFKVNLSSTK
jgi:hypothetical protein